MHRILIVACFCMALMFVPRRIVWSAEPVTLENVVEPAPNQSDELIAAEFSLDRAATFLDSASLQWQKQRKCMSCHTNYAFL